MPGSLIWWQHGVGLWNAPLVKHLKVDVVPALGSPSRISCGADAYLTSGSARAEQGSASSSSQQSKGMTKEICVFIRFVCQESVSLR